MTEYTETTAPEGDTRGEVIDQLCDHNFWVLTIAELDEDGSTNLKVECSGGMGISSVRALLTKTLNALPKEG